MNFYTLRSAAKRLALSYQTVGERLKALKAQGVDLPVLHRDNDKINLIPEHLLPLLRHSKPQTEAQADDFQE